MFRYSISIGMYSIGIDEYLTPLFCGFMAAALTNALESILSKICKYYVRFTLNYKLVTPTSCNTL